MSEHITVLLHEAVQGLNIQPDGIYVDCTLGRGGHSELILKQLTSGHLYAFDQDSDAIQQSKERLEKVSSNFTLIHANFVHLKQELAARGITQVNGILFDLGVSSPQFDEPERGFSYNYDATLDMRMDQRQRLTAYDIINAWPYERLVSIFFQYGEESFAKSIARRIEDHRSKGPINTTFELVEIIKEGIPAKARRTGGHPARKVFQAIRIAVNDELNVLKDALADGLTCLAPKGRMSVITFHSLEDRIVKELFVEASTAKQPPKNIPVLPSQLKQAPFSLVHKKALIPSVQEIEANPRSRSAKLRVIEFIGD